MEYSDEVWHVFATNLLGYPNTSDFEKLYHIVNKDFELAKTLEVLNGSAESAIIWLNRKVPRLKRLPINYLSDENSIKVLKNFLTEWYDVPPPYSK